MWTPAAIVIAILGVVFGVTARPALGASASEVYFDGDVRLHALLLVPDGRGPFPAVVALHGCSGLMTSKGDLTRRHRDWAERLVSSGFVVLMPDSYESRGLGSQCRNEERAVRPARERVSDAKAALHYLEAQPNVKASAISLLGWSNGGSSVLYTVEAHNKPSAGHDYARAIAFYPGCRVPYESARWNTRLSLLILIGGADDWTPAAPCRELAEQGRAAGESVEVVIYPGAYHDFDDPTLPVHTIGGLAYTASGGGSAHSGTNPQARADSIDRVLGFLAR